MSKPTDRFVIETGTGTVAHIIDTDSDESESAPGVSLSFSGSGRKMCSRGYRDFRSQQLPFSVFVDEQDIDKSGFEGDAPDEICSYCWSNTREELETDKARTDTDHANRIGGVGYRLRWKQKGRARDEWYDILVRPETTMAELDRLVCRFTTAAIEKIESLQAAQKAAADADPAHKSSVRTDIGPRGSTIRTTTLIPDDAKEHADDLSVLACDPGKWQ